ncbi:MAG TPA: glycosyltransferase family 9 protein [Bacteroidales bacterium]|nr:glycosyltransferase family 9 protein [Bacteroidales bacterium]
MKVKFIILRFSSIGDIVLTTPVIRCLKEQVEGAEIHFVTKKKFASVVADNPYIDKIHLLDGKLKSLIEELRQEECDHIIDLHHNLRTYIVKKKLGLFAFSFDKINIQKWLMVQFKINKLPQKHIVDRYLETCRLFDVTNDGKGLDFFINPKNEIEISQLPSFLQNGYIALVIGGMHGTKQMPNAKLAELSNKLNLPVVLLGGPDDSQAAESIINESKNANIFNACGKYNLQQSASIVKQAKLVIAHDTGLMHIAAAFKKRIISIWGNTIPEFGMYPYVSDENQAIFEVKGLKCRPCSKIGYKKCPKGHHNCMNLIDVNKIAEKANSWI